MPINDSVGAVVLAMDTGNVDSAFVGCAPRGREARITILAAQAAYDILDGIIAIGSAIVAFARTYSGEPDSLVSGSLQIYAYKLSVELPRSTLPRRSLRRD
jgi:hypothetical protein